MSAEIPDTLPELVELVRKLVKAKTIEIHEPSGDYLIPDPAYAGLLALVEEKCRGCKACQHTPWDLTSPLCDGTGCITSTDGAVEGALKKVLLRMRPLPPLELLREFTELQKVSADTRIPALQAVAKYLEATQCSINVTGL